LSKWCKLLPSTGKNLKFIQAVVVNSNNKVIQNYNFVVLYRWRIWSLTLSYERRLRVFESRVMRRIFGPRKDKVTGEWRKLHNEELNDLYCSLNIIWVLK